jgi:hypothetical protein
MDLTSPGGVDAAMAAPPMDTPPTNLDFRTVDNPSDPAFNQLCGINDQGVIAGYFGSGAAGHPTKGYQVRNGATSLVVENVPNSVQTMVAGLNNQGATVGFWSAANNANPGNTGFVAMNGSVHNVAFPTNDNSNPPVNQLLGINDDGMAVGFYDDAAGHSHGYTYDNGRNAYTPVNVNGANSVTVTAINDRGMIAGYDTTAAGVMEGFLRGSDGSMRHLSYPGASMTQALGLSNRNEVVGVYAVGTGPTAQTHGFAWTARAGFKTVDDPNGVGNTTVNGVNDAGDLVGFYMDRSGRTHGMVAMPGAMTSNPQATSGGKPGGGGNGSNTEQLTLQAMPSGTVTVWRTDDGHYQVQINATGFTPGQSHTAEIDFPNLGPVIRFVPIQADGNGAIKNTFVSTGTYDALPDGSRFVLHVGAAVGDSHSPVSDEILAQSDVLPNVPTGAQSMLTAVHVNAGGGFLGTLSGSATVTYDPTAQRLTVTVNASGVGPGNHAAHIHSGSCARQGQVLYMLNDFTADANGNIVNQTRTVDGVTTAPARGSWYLNLHDGGTNQILNTLVPPQPTLAFRPLLCANL